MPINKLLITDSGVEKNTYMEGLSENTSLSPSWSPIPLLQATLSPFREVRGGLEDWGQCVVFPFLLLLFVP